MNIAIVTETFPPEVNGVAMTFGVIASELGRRGHDVTVFRPRRDDLPRRDAHDGFSEIAMPGFPIPRYPMLRLGWPAERRLRRLWKHGRPDLVHVATEGPLGVSAIAAARGLGIPVSSSFHTNFHRYAPLYGYRMLGKITLGWLRRVHNRTRRTFVPTAELSAELADLGFRDLKLLSRGVDTRQFRPDRRSESLRKSWGADEDTPVVLHVGRMAPEKNYDLLFEIYAAMARAEPKLKFVLAGDGPLKNKLVRQHPECVFAGFFSREEIGRYYASADIYIHASLTETFGNVLTEAMASGLAVAGFDYAAARQFVRHEVTGLSVPCDRADELTAAAVRLAEDRELRKKLKVGARLAVEAQSWGQVIEKFEADLAEVAGMSSAPKKIFAAS